MPIMWMSVSLLLSERSDICCTEGIRRAGEVFVYVMDG